MKNVDDGSQEAMGWSANQGRNQGNHSTPTTSAPSLKGGCADWSAQSGSHDDEDRRRHLLALGERDIFDLKLLLKGAGLPRDLEQRAFEVLDQINARLFVATVFREMDRSGHPEIVGLENTGTYSDGRPVKNRVTWAGGSTTIIQRPYQSG